MLNTFVVMLHTLVVGAYQADYSPFILHSIVNSIMSLSICRQTSVDHPLPKGKHRPTIGIQHSTFVLVLNTYFTVMLTMLFIRRSLALHGIVH